MARALFLRARASSSSCNPFDTSTLNIQLLFTWPLASRKFAQMPNLATWIRPKDAKWFRAIFSKHPEIKVWNARNRHVRLAQMDGLLLTGGSDISPEFLRQEIPDPSVLDKQIDPERDRWEFQAVKDALSRGLPILAICKGLQVFNVALGGTLKLDIKGHNLPEQKDRDVQPLRSARRASHR